MKTSCAGPVPVHHLCQCIHLVAVDQDIEEDEVTFPVIDYVIIKRTISLGDGF